MKLGPDDRQRQHVAGCKPSRNIPPSRMSQSCHTVSQSHQILVVSLNRHHVTLGLPLPRGLGTDTIPQFTIICLNTTGIVPITIALHRIADRPLVLYLPHPVEPNTPPIPVNPVFKS